MMTEIGRRLSLAWLQYIQALIGTELLHTKYYMEMFCLQENSDYNERRCHAFVGDVSDPSAAFPFPAESVDVIVLIFVMSAINPEKYD